MTASGGLAHEVDAPRADRQRAVAWTLGFIATAGLVVAAPALAPAVLLLPVVAAVWVVSTRSPVTGLLLFVVLLLLLPARWVIGPLGGAGSPASVVAIGMGGWWVLGRLPGPSHFDRGEQPARTAAFLMLAAAIASYAAGMLRPISGFEVNGADRLLLFLLAGAAVVCVTADGVPGRRALDRLLGLVTALVAVVAAVGIVQFATGYDLAAAIEVPGLRLTGTVAGLHERAGLRRVAGTATHPIEFGLVMAATLPLALHYARCAASWRARAGATIATSLVVVAIPLALARSALIATLAALVVVGLGVTPPVRRRLVASAVTAVGLLLLFAPRVATTLTDLFAGASRDPSVVNRFADFGPVAELVRQRPVFGHGLGTFSPEKYFVVDNQYLVTLIESGLVGLTGVVTPFVVGLWLARQARSRLTDVAGRDLAQALAAGLVAGLVGMASLGFFSFKMVSGLAFLLVGAVGALWRLATPDRATASPPAETS